MNKQEIEKAIEILESFDLTEDEELKNAIETSLTILVKQLAGDWIPVSKRLPEENGRYMTTSKLDEETETYDLWFEDERWFVDMEDDLYEGIVAAWCNMPEPYTEEAKK